MLDEATDDGGNRKVNVLFLFNSKAYTLDVFFLDDAPNSINFSCGLIDTLTSYFGEDKSKWPICSVHTDGAAYCNALSQIGLIQAIHFRCPSHLFDRDLTVLYDEETVHEGKTRLRDVFPATTTKARTLLEKYCLDKYGIVLRSSPSSGIRSWHASFSYLQYFTELHKCSSGRRICLLEILVPFLESQPNLLRSSTPVNKLLTFLKQHNHFANLLILVEESAKELYKDILLFQKRNVPTIHRTLPELDHLLEFFSKDVLTVSVETLERVGREAVDQLSETVLALNKKVAEKLTSQKAKFFPRETLEALEAISFLSPETHACVKDKITTPEDLVRRVPWWGMHSPLRDKSTEETFRNEFILFKSIINTVISLGGREKERNSDVLGSLQAELPSHEPSCTHPPQHTRLKCSSREALRSSGTPV